ncbi:CaiB/BaiF CoA-transferase family protein [Caballeronia sp. LZ065]|uniref:CaiB/BaiF CoA transferase family protein n=1 Tax=Caballeronia sp. LZ065 TaxID=3038571 RepID=UPI00285AC983|nr:CaiB/BaiF CoA-transferase family protein [Caballeronia sp. LZ065]MDR5781088.1 CaiB/BaiF CoA-transferase family protein [Caballeronia sp. LZ065]
MSTAPLAGRRVIELGSMLAAPFATHILAQLGAEIIKVEPPNGDPTRSLVRGGPSGTLIAYSHGKKSVCMDLSKPGAREALMKLLATADGFVHNLAPKAARKLGVTRDECEAANPRLIYCHIRGYAAGPQEEDLASNPVAEASTGVMETNRNNGRPSRLGPSYHDQFAGAYAVIGMLAEMLRVDSPTARKHVEVGLYETGLHVASRDLVGVQLKTQLLGRPEREPHGEFSMPGYGAYLTSDSRWGYLLILNDGHWLRFCQALQLPEAEDASLATLRLRKKVRDKVEDIVRDAIQRHTFDELSSRLTAAGVGFTEVVPLERVLDAPQARFPGKLREVDYRGLVFDVPEFPRAPDDEALESLPPPELGEHSLDVLRSVGISDDALDSLLSSGAVLAHRPDAFAWAPVHE